ncbi:substrate-binding domain-containing protein [Vibrio sp. S4M6]|uniref:substrate-binding domain-containing protein n=1 Tax=Vibrio sinus TaxID=2946865 RepID=UPI00202A571A|nr:substrate-binding domain-containing protein [Vibrio sinus]MCL9781775.1 substrate-binding domain-containing protein [Vibrio sinus]
MKKCFLTAMLLAYSYSFLAHAKEYTFAVVPKFYGTFFDQSKYGCVDAAKQLPSVKCIYRGPEKANVRVQDKIVKQLISEGVDGIAIAVTQSAFLAENSVELAKKAGIPIVTYDADFDAETLKKYQDLRSSYIGTNNFELGKALGEQLKRLRPNGGTLIIQSGRPDSPNLNLRIMGVRSVLSGKTYQNPPGEMLKDDNGWTEVRKPFYNFDQLDRALKQMDSMLKGKRIIADSFVAVGGWPQNDEAAYRKMIEPYKDKVRTNEVAIVISDASASQLAMLKDHLASANIGQNPYEMGKQAIFTLLKIVQKEHYQKVIYTPLKVCTPDNYQTCSR